VNEDNSVNLDKILSRVRTLIAKAEHPIADGATPTEREAAIVEQTEAMRMADALMLRYRIDRAMANNAMPAATRTKPVIIEVEVGDGYSDIIGHIGSLCQDIATHCRCRVRLWSRYEFKDGNATYFAKIYGFEGDAKYFEMLYTTLRLHMLGLLMPRFDPALSFEDNCYHLHNAGYNWMQMAAMQGWKKFPGQKGVAGHLIRYYNQKLGQEDTAGKIGGGIYKKAYQKACKARGEAPKVIAAGSTDTYRKSAASGYTTRLAQRLYNIREGRDSDSRTGELVLRSTFEDLDALFREDNPDLFKKIEATAEVSTGKKYRPKKYKEPSFSQAGYGTGVSHADRADLGTGIGGAPAKEIS
jgi:hypothetical protein